MTGNTRSNAATQRKMQITTLVLLICGLILCFDIGGELHALVLYPLSFSGLALFHLGTELLATLGLGLAFVLLKKDLRRTMARYGADRDQLQALRGNFDHLLHQRFRDWGLSPAESDVALLTMRGMKIAEIAQMRKTHVGTIKSQLSTIFRKSGVSTRTEFVARFIDEFLDLSASPAKAT